MGIPEMQRGYTADALADPFDVGCDLFGRMHGLAEDGKGARVDDGGDDILAVGERHDGELDPQHGADLGPQGIFRHGEFLADVAARPVA